jgi:hypothetical protein
MVWIVEQERLLIVEHGLCFEGDAVFAEILASLGGIPIETRRRRVLVYGRRMYGARD